MEKIIVIQQNLKNLNYNIKVNNKFKLINKYINII